MNKLIFAALFFTSCCKIFAQDTEALGGIWLAEGYFDIHTLDDSGFRGKFLKYDFRQNGLVYTSHSFFERGIPGKYLLRDSKVIVINMTIYTVAYFKDGVLIISPDGKSAFTFVKAPTEKKTINSDNILFDGDQNVYKADSALHPTLNMDISFYDLLLKYRLQDKNLVPSYALTEKEDTELELTFIVNKRGEVKNISVLGATQDKTQDYINNIQLTSRLWTPAILDGKPVDSELKLTIRRNGLKTIEKETKADFLYRKGIRLYERGNYFDVASAATKALFLIPTDQRYLLLRANAFLKLKNKQLACEDLRKITEYKLDSVKALIRNNCK